MDSYWDITNRYLREHGKPMCSSCGKEMSAEDDHGRFRCFSCGNRLDVTTGTCPPTLKIPQVDTTGMTDEEKARIPPMNRLHAPPTKAEARLLEILSGDLDALDSPECRAAREALDQERGEPGP